MTDEDKIELCRLNGIVEDKKVSLQCRGQANTFGKTPEELKEISNAYQLALVEYDEAQSNLNKFKFRFAP